jgi:hypothetical protein
MAAARDAVWRAEPELSGALDRAVDLVISRYLSSAGPVVQQLTDEYRAQVARLDASLRDVLATLSAAKRRQAELSEHGLAAK